MIREVSHVCPKGSGELKTHLRAFGTGEIKICNNSAFSVVLFVILLKFTPSMTPPMCTNFLS